MHRYGRSQTPTIRASLRHLVSAWYYDLLDMRKLAVILLRSLLLKVRSSLRVLDHSDRRSRTDTTVRKRSRWCAPSCSFSYRTAPANGSSSKPNECADPRTPAGP